MLKSLGGELIPQGNFGTIESEGKNGDATGAKSLYPGTETTAGIYYQPTKKMWTGWWPVVLSDTPVNPGVTIGHAIDNRTTYKWGFTQTWADGNFLLPKVSDNSNTGLKVPHAPNEGYYVIATSTEGMYRSPVLSSNSWVGPLYDKNETDFENPTNYFMIVDADMNPTKIFYEEEVNVQSGHLYRMSVDVARLNRDGITPSIAFVVSPNSNNLSSIEPKASKNLTSLATWENLHFDYIVPEGVTKLYVAFRNNVSGGTGNDLALDNLSMREVVARIYADPDASDPCRTGMTLKLVNAEFFAGRTIGWQKKNEAGAWTTISGASGSSYLATVSGDYRAVIYIDNQGGFYSANEIRVTRTGSCFGLVDLIATDDSYQALPGIAIKGNVLANDIHPVGLDGDVVSVVKYKVDGVEYSVGSSANIYEGATLLGTVTISSDGTLVFKSVTNIVTPKKLPTITYTEQDSFGAEAEADVVITVVSELSIPVNVSYDASCIQCPIFVKLTEGAVAGETYTLYRNNVSKGVFSASNFDLTFNETVSGSLEYQVRKSNGDVVKTFTMEVHPASAEWSDVAENSVWRQSSNWKASTGSGYPIWCTDVTIPSATTTYPVLVNGDAARDVTFKDGASVGQIHKLNYRKAFVEFNPDRNRWYMLSAPLRYMYSADLHGDMSWTNAISPKVFMMYFDVINNINPDGRAGYSIGSFSRPFANLEEELTAGKSYTAWVNGVGNGFNYADSNFPTGTSYKFPRSVNGQEPQYSYHNSLTGEWTTPVVGLSRGDVSSIATDEQWEASKGVLTNAQKDNKYRFAFESAISGEVLTIPVEGGVLNAIGNPFMSHVDFERFVLDNKDKIQGYYRIWDGEKFYLYVADISANTAWSGLGGLTTETSEGVVSQYIAPMQSFFVEVKEGVSSLVFNADNVLGSNTQSRLRSVVSPDNLLKIELKMNGVSSSTFIASREGASASYIVGEDISKLFSPNVAIPEVYSIVDRESVELNVVGEDAENQQIDLGIHSSQVGDAEFTIDGIDDFGVYESIVLKDNVLGNIYDLKTVSNIKFSKTSKDNLESRFSLFFSGKSSSIEEGDKVSQPFIVSIRGGEMLIESTDRLLHTIELFDASGRLRGVARNIEAQSSRLSIINLDSGIYVLRVTGENGAETMKVVF